MLLSCGLKAWLCVQRNVWIDLDLRILNCSSSLTREKALRFVSNPFFQHIVMDEQQQYKYIARVEGTPSPTGVFPGISGPPLG